MQNSLIKGHSFRESTLMTLNVLYKDRYMACGLHEIKRVINSHSIRDATTRRININMDVFLGIFHLQEEELSDDGVGNIIVDWGPNKNNSIT